MRIEQKAQPNVHEASTRTDDFGFEVNAVQAQVVIDDFGIQVTDNPIWAEQRLDPGLVLHVQSQPIP